MFVDFNMKKNQYLLYSYSRLIETRYSFLFSKLSTIYILVVSEMRIIYQVYGHILNAFYGYIVEAIFFIAWLMHVWLLCSSCQCNFFQFYWLTQELWNMILTLLILYHSKCVFISWNVYVILKQLVLRKRDPIIDSKDFANVRRSQDSQTSFLILRICQEKLPFL